MNARNEWKELKATMLTWLKEYTRGSQHDPRKYSDIENKLVQDMEEYTRCKGKGT